VPDKPAAAPPTLGFNPQADAPTCSDCGSIMIRNGACYKCWNCGATSGCS
jgi:ribonucleoside-diphosphate reductase alpha chain